MGRRSRRSWIPVVLAAGMLAFVVAASLAPDTGTVAADSSCPYGNCNPAPTQPFWHTSLGILLLSLLAVAAVVAAAAAILLWRRGRAPPKPEETYPPEGAERPSEAAATEEEPPPPEEPDLPDVGPPPSDDVDGLLEDLERLTRNGNS